MAKITVEKGGKIRIPSEYAHSKGLYDGAELILESTEGGLMLHRPELDVSKVYIEVTTRCNLNCVTCVRNVWDEAIGDMEMAIFGVVIEQLKSFPKLRAVAFGGFGEPLCHPHILQMIKAVKDLNVELTISTNGTYLDGSFAAKLVDYGVDKIIFSLDSVQPENFGEIRQGAVLNALTTNIKELSDIKVGKGKTSPTIGIEFVAMKRNLNEVEELPKIAKSLGVSVVLLTNLLPHTAEMQREILYNGNTELPNLPGWSVKAGDRWLQWGTISRPRMKWGAFRRCRFVENRSFVIAHDGEVSPCYALMHSYPCYIFSRYKQLKRYTLGNLCDKHLTEIWTSAEYVKFRSKVRTFAFPSCVDCELDACGYPTNNEDCWGNSPSCADCLWAQDIIRCP